MLPVGSPLIMGVSRTSPSASDPSGYLTMLCPERLAHKCYVSCHWVLRASYVCVRRLSPRATCFSQCTTCFTNLLQVSSHSYIYCHSMLHCRWCFMYEQCAALLQSSLQLLTGPGHLLIHRWFCRQCG